METKTTSSPAQRILAAQAVWDDCKRNHLLSRRDLANARQAYYNNDIDDESLRAAMDDEIRCQLDLAEAGEYLRRIS